jgi:ribosome maturation factor RimP
MMKVVFNSVDLCYNPRRFRWALSPFFICGCAMDVAKLVETTLIGLGYELVDLELSGRGLMRVFIDKTEGIAIQDCERVSNQLTRLFTVEGVDFGRLEVSSPGLDRPVKKESDFVRFHGRQAQLKLRVPIGGRKNFVGVLGELKDGVLQLEVDGEIVAIELANLDKARLVPVF